MVAKTFGIGPTAAAAEDEQLAVRAMQALHAQDAVDAMGDKNRTPTEYQRYLLDRMFDALDERDRAAGVTEEA